MATAGCIEPAAFREAMSRLGAAVHVVTTDGPGGKGGFTATAVCAISDAPAMLLGGVSDLWQREVIGIGPTGHDKGKGGKFLLLPKVSVPHAAYGKDLSRNVGQGVRRAASMPLQIIRFDRSGC